MEKEYKIEIKETLVKIIENEDYNIVRKKYSNGEYVLGCENHHQTNIFLTTRPQNPKMRSFKDNEVAIIETLARVISIWANSAKNALALVEENYTNGGIVLDYNDFVCVEFE